MMAHPTHQGEPRRIGRCLYVWREPDVSIRHTSRFCSLGPPPAAGPVSTPLDRVTPGESSERFLTSISSRGDAAPHTRVSP